jgi:hypothetical protein
VGSAVWKIPARWTSPGLCDRTALYPALYLRWTGHQAMIGRDIPTADWTSADLRVLVTEGGLLEDDRALLHTASEWGQAVVIAPQAALHPEDLALVAALGMPVAAWTDPGPLASPPPQRPGVRTLVMTGCAVRPAEDLLLARMLGLPAQPPDDGPVKRTRQVVVAAESAAAFAEVWPALARRVASTGARLTVTSEDEAALHDIAALAPDAAVLTPQDPLLPGLLARAEAFLCIYPGAAPESPRPGQWTRSALYAGAPVIAASHPSIDGLAHLCVLDDWERGLKLYGRYPIERLKPVAAAQAEIGARIAPEAIAAEWSQLMGIEPQPPVALGQEPRRPVLLTLIDIHQDLDVLLPVLLALKQRDELELRQVVTDWLVSESPRILNVLAAHGFAFEVHARTAVREGEEPSLEGVDGVLSGADTTARAHKAGHTLARRAEAKGAPTFTLQHGFENIGLTYEDHLHGGDHIRFAAKTIFTWGPLERLADWAVPETRAAALPVGSPKTAPAPAARLNLNQGFWPRTVGVFENLHWHRFSDAYRDAVIQDLQAIAAAHPDTLFIVKPHHAGRWLVRNPDRLAERPNLVVIDPTDSAWEPHTAPAFIASVDLVLTTPSTVAMDAARTGRPVAVLGYDLDLPLYEPLPIVRGLADLEAVLDLDDDAYLLANEAFLNRARLPGRADHRIAARIAEKVRAGLRAPAAVSR